LNEGTLLGKSNREGFSEGCYKNLFYLCAQGSQPDNNFSCNMVIARMVTPHLLNRCKELLQRFIQEDKMSGNFPIARSKLQEVSFVLKQLLSMEINSDLDAGTPQHSPLYKGKKRHLLVLFPLLCDCIMTKEVEIKELLKEIFHAAAKEIGLE